MSVVITTYTLASGLMAAGHELVAGDGHDPARQHDRAHPDDPERARRHEVRRFVSRCCAGRASACAARTCRRCCARSSPAAGSASRRGSARSRSTRCSAAAWPRLGAASRARLPIAFAIFWGIQVVIILKGTKGIKVLESWSAPLLLGGGALLLVVGRSSAAAGSDAFSASRRSCSREQRPFWALFPAALTANVGYWATLSLNIPDFTRYAKSQRSQVLGQALGLPTTMTAFAFIGVAVTSATIVIFGEPIWDPVELVTQIGGAASSSSRRSSCSRRSSRRTWPRTSCRRRTTSRI